MTQERQNGGSDLHRGWMTARWHAHLKGLLDRAQAQGDQDTVAALSARLREAVVIKPEDVEPDHVQFGSRVTIFEVEEQEELTFEIVSFDEANIHEGLLDEGSDLAQALLDAEEGDVVEVTFPNGAFCAYEVTHVHPPRH